MSEQANRRVIISWRPDHDLKVAIRPDIRNRLKSLTSGPNILPSGAS